MSKKISMMDPHDTPVKCVAKVHGSGFKTMMKNTINSYKDKKKHKYYNMISLYLTFQDRFLDLFTDYTGLGDFDYFNTEFMKNWYGIIKMSANDVYSELSQIKSTVKEYIAPSIFSIHDATITVEEFNRIAFMEPDIKGSYNDMLKLCQTSLILQQENMLNNILNTQPSSIDLDSLIKMVDAEYKKVFHKYISLQPELFGWQMEKLYGKWTSQIKHNPEQIENYKKVFLTKCIAEQAGKHNAWKIELANKKAALERIKQHQAKQLASTEEDKALMNQLKINQIQIQVEEKRSTQLEDDIKSQQLLELNQQIAKQKKWTKYNQAVAMPINTSPDPVPDPEPKEEKKEEEEKINIQSASFIPIERMLCENVIPLEHKQTSSEPKQKEKKKKNKKKKRKDKVFSLDQFNQKVGEWSIPA